VAPGGRTISKKKLEPDHAWDGRKDVPCREEKSKVSRPMYTGGGGGGGLKKHKKNFGHAN